MHFTDIKQLKYIELLPKSIRPYAYLARLDRPIGWWLLLLPAWWAIGLSSGGLLSMNYHDWSIIILFLCGAVLMRAAGCVINDLWDKDLDKKVERTQLRPLAKGTISTKKAFIFLSILLALSLLILLQLSPVAILLGFLTIPFIVIYPLMKRITWWPQAFLGLTFNFGALIGWAAIDMVVSLSALILYISALFWTLGYDTIYAHQDKEDDIKIGIKSTAIKFGSKSKSWVSLFYAISWALLLLSFILAKAGIVSIVLLIIPALHLKWQINNWDINSQEDSLNTFKSNQIYGLLVFLCILL